MVVSSYNVAIQIAEVFMLGIIGGSVPGPILAAVFTEVVNGGLAGGFKVIVKALMVEVLTVILMLLVVSVADISEYYFHIVSLFGAVFLVYLSLSIWKIDSIRGENGTVFDFSRILLLTVLNGGFWIFWLTVCVPKAFAMKEQIVGGEFLFLAAFELGWFAMTSLLAFVFSKFRRLLLQKNLISPVFKFFAIALIFFAVRTAWGSISYFLK